MGIDTSIYSQLKPVQIDNPLDTYARLAQVQGAQQQNRLADLVFTEKQREIDEGNALSRLYREAAGANGEIDQNKLYTGMARDGLGAKIPGVREQFMGQDAAKVKMSKERAELVDAKLKQSRAFLESVTTPEQFIAWHEGNHADPVLGPELASRGVTADQARASIMKAINEPGGFERLLKQSQLGLEKFSEIYKPKIETRNLGGTTDTISVDPLTGKVTTLNSAKNTMTPDGIAADARGREANRLKQQEIGVMRDGIVSKKVQDVELKLQDDYRAESKGFSETSTAMKKVLGSISTADKNPGSALAAGTAFMKLLDPNSVVRESELGMALNASGWFDRALNVANTLQSGKVMTTTQKANLQKAAETLFEEAKAAQREIDSAYEQRAKAYGADPSRVIVDRGQRTSAAPKPAANIPQGAIDMLKKNPALRAQFEAKYGQGSAASVLGK